MTRINVPLQPDEKKALWLLAKQKRRNPRAQAAILIRQSLERLNLLPFQATAQATPPQEAHHDAKN